MQEGRRERKLAHDWFTTVTIQAPVWRWHACWSPIDPSQKFHTPSVAVYGRGDGHIPQKKWIVYSTTCTCFFLLQSVAVNARAPIQSFHARQSLTSVTSVWVWLSESVTVSEWLDGLKLNTQFNIVWFVSTLYHKQPTYCCLRSWPRSSRAGFHHITSSNNSQSCSDLASRLWMLINKPKLP